MNKFDELIKEAKESLERLVKQANARKLSNDIVVSRWDVEKIEKAFELLDLYEHKSYLQEEIMKKTFSDVRKQDIDFEDYYVYKEELEKVNKEIKEKCKDE